MGKKKQPTKSQLLKKYVTMVERHDFAYAFADDHQVWLNGTREWAEIAGLQPSIDPDWIIFNDIAPEPYRVKVKHK